LVNEALCEPPRCGRAQVLFGFVQMRSERCGRGAGSGLTGLGSGLKKKKKKDKKKKK
jgi:hypothetical protein